MKKIIWHFLLKINRFFEDWLGSWYTKKEKDNMLSEHIFGKK